VNSEHHKRGSFEARLSRLREEPVDGRATPGAGQRAVVPRKASSAAGPPKVELSDEAANLIASVMKDFLRD
jgi:hypothetical protein